MSRRASAASSPARVRVALLGLLVGALATHPDARGAAKSPRRVFSPPAGTCLQTPAHTALSPSGRWLAFVATDTSGTDRLWVRSLPGGSARLLRGTEGARYPFWSPDGRALGYFAGGQLWRIAPEGASAQALCTAKDGHGGAWSSRGVIVFAPDDEGALMKVDARGGAPTAATHMEAELDSSDHRESVEEEDRPEPGHRMPCFLPDGKHFLFQEYPGDEGLYRTCLASIEGGEPRAVLTASSVALYAAPGYLVFSRGQRLMAQKWDAARLEAVGPAMLLDVSADSGVEGEFRVSFSSVGAMAYSTRATMARLEWTQGGERVPMEAGPYVDVEVSPDRHRAALVRFVSADDMDLWLVELATGVASRFTHEKGEEREPSWSRDGARLQFWSNRDGRWRAYSRATDGSGEAEVVKSPLPRNMPKRFQGEAATARAPDRVLVLVPLPDRSAGHTVIPRWRTLLR